MLSVNCLPFCLSLGVLGIMECNSIQIMEWLSSEATIMWQMEVLDLVHIDALIPGIMG